MSSVQESRPAEVSTPSAGAEAKNNSAAEPHRAQEPAGDGQEEASAESLQEEGRALCESIEKSYRRVLGDMPNKLELADMRSHLAAIQELVGRAASSGAGAHEELAALRKERDAYKEQAARAKADFLNYQQRAQRDLAAAEESVLRGYVSELLPVLDSLDLSLADIRSGKADKAMVSAAVEMVAVSLEQALKVRGLERIQAQGKPFDPLVHEAVSVRPADKGKGEESNQVLEELRSGFLWKGKLLRPCQVLAAQREAAG